MIALVSRLPDYLPTTHSTDPFAGAGMFAGEPTGKAATREEAIPVEMRKLGGRGPEISVVGYGAWEAGGDFYGPNPSDQAVIEAIHTALGVGMNWIDTAEVYGNGRSEELVGEAIAGRRDEVFIFTKVGSRPEGSGYRPEGIRRAITASLSRLGTDHVDLYQIHWPVAGMSIEGAWGAMADLVDEGLAKHIGVSNFDRRLIERCLAIRHVDSVQNQFSLLHQNDRDTLLPWLADQGIGYLAWSPLALGLLTGAFTKDTTFPVEDARSGARFQGGLYREHFERATFEANIEKVDRLRPIAQRLGVPVSALALRWVVEQQGVTAAIAGSRNPNHVRGNASAGEIRLDERTLEEIDEIFD
jgi:aryl-alcohol dehydrogenase-like predicted oxidoreductase